MDTRVAIVERALQMAGALSTLAAIRNQLVAEGYEDVDAQLSGYTVRRILKRIIERGEPGLPPVA